MARIPGAFGDVLTNFSIPQQATSTTPSSPQTELRSPISAIGSDFDLSPFNRTDSPGEAKYLDMIDSLRDLGISDTVSLPQLVVVGDQSSGKSALLEGLTHISFPVANDLCTRFATQIVMRRSDEATFSASLVPGRTFNEDPGYVQHLEKFNPELPDGVLEASTFQNLLRDASKHLGLPVPSESAHEESDDSDKEEDEEQAGEETDNVPTNRFSEAILKIELTGPTYRNLSVVDLPGLFHNPTQNQTEEDNKMIRLLINQYIEDKRSIIIAVMDATSNLSNQEVFLFAHNADPLGQRTVGVITKIDLVQAGDKRNILKIAQNQKHPLTHGWFLSRNRSTQDIRDKVTIEQRHQNERRDLDKAPWSQIPLERRGVSNLQKYLSRLLYNHVRKELPNLIREMDEYLRRAQGQLHKLGPARNSIADQRSYLNALATQYQHHVEDALSGAYENLANTQHLKLGKVIHALREAFVSRMDHYGHSYIFSDTEKAPSSTNSQNNNTLFGSSSATDNNPTVGNTFNDGNSGSGSTGNTNNAGFGSSSNRGFGSTNPNFFRISTSTDHGNTTSENLFGQAAFPSFEFGNDVLPRGGIKSPLFGISDWIRQAYRDTRGSELPGIINPKILESLFQHQSKNWDTISHHLLGRFHQSLLSYNTELFRKLVDDQGVRSRLEAAAKEKSSRSMEDAKKQLENVLNDERRVLQTTNELFTQKLQRAREARIVARLEGLGYSEGANKNINMRALLGATHPGHEEQAVHDIHDILKAYYDVSKERFKDAVLNNVIKRHLQGPNGPIRVFSPQYIGGFKTITDHEISILAAENETTTATRNDLTRRVSSLQKALEMARNV